MNFSKSKYCAFRQCPKLAWLKKYKPELEETDEAVQARFDSGTQVGELARGMFGEHVDVSSYKADGSLDLSAMADKTKALVESGAENICEAAFVFDGLYCAVDILHKERGGYAIYEVKSSTDVKQIYLADVAYQKYVLEKCGINVTGVYVAHINNKYERHGALDVPELFARVDVSGMISEEYALVPENLTLAEKLLARTDAPDVDIGNHCTHPYKCGFWKFCSAHLPKPSVLDIYSFADKWKCYGAGIVSFRDVINAGVKLKPMQARQVEHTLYDKGTYVDKDKLSEFIGTLSYPLYFLDFESMQLAVPQFDGTRPYMQIPFQYSLHYIEHADGEVIHKEFLGESGKNPMRALAESICRDIPANVCVVAYSKSFECMVLKDLSERFPDLSEHLLSVCANIKDMIDPFKKGYYYNRAMGGSFSIKSVLPAVFPDDPTANYHNLDGVHNGSEAKDIFPRIKDMPREDAERARKELLEYCALDTFAMVRLYKELLSRV